MIDLRAEMEGSALGDPRLARRARLMMEATLKRPGASLPVAMGDTAGREGAYRFLSNRRVTLRRVLASHVEATVARARAAKKVLLVSDTTEFKFSTEREGLGLLSSTRREGFLGHFTLAVSADGHRTPLGMVAVETLTRSSRKGKRDHFERKKDPERESLRWYRCADTASRQMEGVEAIHVMDREADIYELLSGLIGAGRRFIIRSSQDRSVDEGRLVSTVGTATMRFEREVKLSARKVAPKPESRRTHPERRGRMARLAVSTKPVALHKATSTIDPTLPDSISVNVVRVWEPDPPTGQEPVEWRLLTTEPVETQEQVEAIIDGYRARWLIEEYFKALKTGCTFESSQLESLRSLENLLGIYVPVAWQLLLLRNKARDHSHLPATTVLTPIQLAVLRLIKRGKPLSLEPTVADVATAIAELGAHIKSNGPPGWQVLGRGFEELRRAEALYTQIISATSTDQS
jgi:hypothetical protein